MEKLPASYADFHPHYHPFIVGENLRLIQPDLSHAAESLSWTASPEVIQFMGADFSDPSIEKEEKRIHEILESTDEYNWMIEFQGRTIGNVSLNSIEEMTKKYGMKTGSLAIVIGQKEAWGKGLGFTFCSQVIRWAFKEAEFKAIAARALQENKASIRLLENLGFTEIGTELYEGLIDGKTSQWRNFILKSTENEHSGVSK